MAQRKSVSGITAPAPRPTVLGAAIVAGSITVPVGAVVLLVDLLLL